MADDGNCGSFKRFKTDVLVSVDGLNNDIKKHLIDLKLLHSYNESDWNEKRLIESRIGKSLLDGKYICAYHRFTKGVCWRSPVRCMHPSHNLGRKKQNSRSKTTRVVPIPMLDKVNQHYGASLPVGAVFCFKHLKDPLPEENEPECVDTSYTPEEVLVTEDQLNSSLESGSQLMDVVDLSPAKFQLKTPVANLSTETARKLQRKYRKLEESFKKPFAKYITPEQERDFIENILNPTLPRPESDIPEELMRFCQIYDNSDNISKMVVLSLVDHSKYTKEFLMGIFHCTKYKIEQARKLNSSSPGLALPQHKTLTRSKLNLMKAEHFLDYIFVSGLLQDVAYGMTKIKYDNGTQQKVAHSVLTAKYSHAVMFYIENCNKTLYKPLSERSLLRILECVKPSQRKSLSGLDDTTAAAMTGFDTLQNFVKKHKKEYEDALIRSKR